METHLAQANADFNYELTPDDHDEEFTTAPRADHRAVYKGVQRVGPLATWCMVGPWATYLVALKLANWNFIPPVGTGRFLDLSWWVCVEV